MVAIDSEIPPLFGEGGGADNLSLGIPTAANTVAWKTLLTTQVFGKSFTNHMKHGFNNGLSQTSSVGMTYSGEWPRSQGDAKELLFADSMTNMVKGGVWNSDGLSVDVGILFVVGRVRL